MVSVDVIGRPAPKGSRNIGRTKTGHSYTYPASKFEAPWVEEVKRATQIVMRHHEQPEPPYAIELDFRLVEPKRNRRDQAEWPVKHDLDKLARAVIDGLVNGGALTDDKHVIALTARKRYIEDGESEGVGAQIAHISVRAGV